ncbi:MAG: hypothetical protein ACI4AA_05190 [Lachnospiraceae bacterium]
MKTKIVGLIVLLIVILAGGGYYIYQNRTEVTELNGYLGGEKIGLFEDEEIGEILQKEYHLKLNYSRAGSLDMVTADLTDRNYLFPSSQTALEYYNDTYGKAVSDEIIFNTPIVLYTHKSVADALTKEGIVTERDGVFYADMGRLTELMVNGTQWSEIGLTELYGTVSVDTTDPTKSNSGNMFAALLANVLNDGKTVDKQSVDSVLPELKVIFGRLGYMETSSSDLFNQFLRMGVGAKPMIAGYESQLLEFAAENPEDYEKVKDDIVMIYPTPTVWSTHIFIALDEEGKAGIAALTDDRIQELAWEKHGFRTSGYDISSDGGEGNVSGVAKTLTSVMNMPEYEVMRKIIDSLQ